MAGVRKLALSCGLAMAAVTVVGAQFRVADTAASRLEAVAGVETTVTVPLLREAAETGDFFLAANGLTNPVVWAEGVAYPQVDVPALTAGTDFHVELLNASKAVIANTAIHIVEEPGNSLRNPWWIGEKTAEELGFGEWTVDLEVARQKLAANEGAHLLVRVSGDLWCPHCQASLTHLWETADFQAWAKANSVILVLIDQPDAQPIFDGYDYTDWELAQGLLANWNSDSYARAGRYGASGASYLSRHGVSAVDAKAVFDRNKQLNMVDWLRPSVPATTKRNGMGTLLLLDADGNEICRPSTYGANDTYPVGENLARFTAALDVTSVAASEPSWTDREHMLGTTDSIELQVNDATAYYRLSGLSIGRLDIAYKARLGSEPVELTILEGEALSLTSVASGIGSVSCGVTREMRDADDLWLRVRSFTDAGKTEYGEANRISGLFTSVFTEMPGKVSFTGKSFVAFESSVSGSVSVVRAGGSFGASSVRIVLKDGGDAENGKRYRWKDRVVTWAEGEEGEKTVFFEVIDDGVKEGRQSFVLGLCTDSLSDAAEIGVPNECRVTVDDSTDPELAQAVYEETVYLGFSVRQAYPVLNLTGGTVKFSSKGVLPKGIRLKYDKRQKTVLLTGTPSGKTCTRAADIQLGERRGAVMVYGQASRFVVEVRDPVATNPFLGENLKKVTIPLYSSSGRMSGVLTVSAKARGRISATYSGIRGKISFSGRWTDLDEATGTARAELEKKDSRLLLEMGPDGALSATVDDALLGATLASVGTAAACMDVEPYVGLYTVTLPMADGASGPANSGTATLMLTVRSTGKVAFKGIAPNGKTVSGTAYLLDHGETAVLPVFISRGKGKDWFGVALDIVPYAAEEYAAGNPVIVGAVGETKGGWGSRTGSFAEQALLDVYGGYFGKDFDLVTCCEEKYTGSRFRAVFDWSKLRCDGQVRSVASGVVNVVSSGFRVSEAGDGFSLKLRKSTGQVRGRSKLTWVSGEKVSMNLRGVILPGWVDCGCTPTPPPERPFASGTAYFSAKVDGRKVKCSIPFALIPMK